VSRGIVDVLPRLQRAFEYSTLTIDNMQWTCLAARQLLYMLASFTALMKGKL
jgi:hypothetical protein